MQQSAVLRPTITLFCIAVDNAVQAVTECFLVSRRWLREDLLMAVQGVTVGMWVQMLQCLHRE